MRVSSVVSNYRSDDGPCLVVVEEQSKATDPILGVRCIGGGVVNRDR